MVFSTIEYEVSDHVATVTLNRPEKLNSFNQRMCDEFSEVWRLIRLDDAVRAVVLRAAGDRAFSTGLDVQERIDMPENVWSQLDPGGQLGPKQNEVWKPVVCALSGMVAAGAFYWVNESDIVICSEETTFFDPHVSYGMVAALEPTGLLHRGVPLGEVLRIALLGLHERLSASRALGLGLVSEVTATGEVWERAGQLARQIAAAPPEAVQGTVRAIWDALDLTRSAAVAVGLRYTQIGNPLGEAQVDRVNYTRPDWRIR